MWMNLRICALEQSKFVETMLAGCQSRMAGIKDPELFEQSKENPWAKDYIFSQLEEWVGDKNFTKMLSWL